MSWRRADVYDSPVLDMRSRTRCLKTFWVGIVSTSFSFDATAGLTLLRPAEKGGRLVPGNRVPLRPIEAGGVSAEAGFGAEHAVGGTIPNPAGRIKPPGQLRSVAAHRTSSRSG